jgi:predicted nucleotidyltransferase
MNETVKTELDRIVSTLVGTGLVSKIILFGSYARGEETPDSDIDLCVLTPVKDRRAIDIGIDLRMKIWDIQKSPLDLLPYNQDEFTDRANRRGSFQQLITEEGVVLYER